MIIKTLKFFIICLLLILVLACESAEDKAVQEAHNAYTGKDNALESYIANETDENNESSLAADYHRVDGKHTDFRAINKYEKVSNGGYTIVARAIIKEGVFSTSSPINKLTITPRLEDNSYTFEAKFIPNEELFPDAETLTAKSGETITFDFSDVSTDVGGSKTSNFGILEVYQLLKDDPTRRDYYDYFVVINQ